MTEEPRAFITGVGAVCAAGLDSSSIWEAIRSGRSAIGPIKQWDASGWPAGQGAEILNVDNRRLVPDRKLHKMLSRLDLFGIYAADQAIEASGLVQHRNSLDPARVVPFNDRSGIFTGSGGGSYRVHDDFHPLLAEANGSMERFGRELDATVNPMWLLRILPNNVLCQVGIAHQFKGANACITNQCVGGIMAVAEAAAALRVAEADRIVAVGYDAPVEPELQYHFHQVGLVSSDLLRPFDRARTGTILGEGAAAVVLETVSEVRARGAAILAEFLGSGCVTEATGILDIRPDGDGVFRAIELALADAGIGPDDVGMIVAHGNGTVASDLSEARGIHRLFGGNAPPVTAFKWAYGHLLAGSGILDLVMALAALNARVVPGIPTLRDVDPEIAPLLPVSSEAKTPRTDIALVICRGFGGMDVAVVVRGASSGIA